MQFVVIARDETDDGALARRMEAREAHLAMSREAMESGERLLGMPLLDDEGQMCGSLILADVPSRAALEDSLAADLYTKNKVWADIEIIPCKIPPGFGK